MTPTIRAQRAPHRAVVWDFDGVLADTRDLSWRVAEEILALLGERRSIRDQETFRTYLVKGSNVSREETQTLRSMHHLVMRSRAAQIPLFDCVSLVARLNVPSEIVTSGLAEVAKRVLGDQASCFSRIRGHETGGKATLLSELGRDVLFITDTTVDIRRAKENLITTVAVAWGYDPEEALLREQPDELARSASELEHLFHKLGLLVATP